MIINIAKDFSETVGARYKSEGDYSAEEFRDDYLILALECCLERNEELVIAFDGVCGYSKEFLEEIFGGLIRNGYSKEEVLSVIRFDTSYDFDFIAMILKYINEAKQNRKLLLTK